MADDWQIGLEHPESSRKQRHEDIMPMQSGGRAGELEFFPMRKATVGVGENSDFARASCVDKCLSRARDIVAASRERVLAIADACEQREYLDEREIERLLAKRAPEISLAGAAPW